MWQQFGHKPIDNLLTSWGAPAGETRLTDGSRMVTYRNGVIFNDANSESCEVSFIASGPHYNIEKISMAGDPYECSLMAKGQRGVKYIVDTPLGPYPYP